MERMENTSHDLMATWMACGGAAVSQKAEIIDDHGHELQAAMLTRSPQACYSIDDQELQAAMLTRSPQACYSIGRDDNGLSAAAYTHSIECRIHS